MKRITLAIGIAAVAGSLFGGTAAADPITVCDATAPNVYRGCTYVYVDENGVCVTGGGATLNRHYSIAPC